MGKTEEDNILGYIEEYYQNYQEIKKIQNDILQYRKKFDSSLNKLKKEMSKIEEHIIKYINDNNHPGIKYKDKIFTPESGKVRISSKKREQNIEKILNKYQINQSHPLYVELYDVFQSKKDNNNIQLKIKKYQK